METLEKSAASEAPSVFSSQKVSICPGTPQCACFVQSTFLDFKYQSFWLYIPWAICWGLELSSKSFECACFWVVQAVGQFVKYWDWAVLCSWGMHGIWRLTSLTSAPPLSTSWSTLGARLFWMACRRNWTWPMHRRGLQPFSAHCVLPPRQRFCLCNSVNPCTDSNHQKQIFLLNLRQVHRYAFLKDGNPLAEIWWESSNLHVPTLS